MRLYGVGRSSKFTAAAGDGVTRGVSATRCWGGGAPVVGRGTGGRRDLYCLKIGNYTENDSVAQRQRVRLQIGRLGVRIFPGSKTHCACCSVYTHRNVEVARIVSHNASCSDAASGEQVIAGVHDQSIDPTGYDRLLSVHIPVDNLPLGISRPI